jgi:N-formylglutamate deformylase
MPATAFHLSCPAKTRTSVVFASPHSGRNYFDSFVSQSALDHHAIRTSEDAFVDRLFESAPKFGAPLLMGGAPRAYVDLNRGAEELDPALIEGVRRNVHNPRVASGLGVIPRVVANGRMIYSGKLSLNEAKRRIDLYWRPYHAELQRLLDRSSHRFGQAILVDCHSMPHEALDGYSGRGPRPDIVLGDRFGAAAASRIVDQVEAAFRSVGLRVSRNAPFAGAYITQAYGRPSRHQHAIQVEIDRSLYMDERLIRPNENFHAFKDVLSTAIAQIAAIGYDDIPLAAE